MCIVHPTSMASSTILAATTMDMTVKLGITLPKSIIQKIDNMRGDIPRSRYIRRAIERYLSKNTAKGNYNENKSTVIKKRRK
jgi:metal-responsive CopG/Arc/MetJ family transcriptional regulator